MRKPGASPLALLSTAALSLPALAAEQPTETTISVRASHYDEDELPARDVLLGAEERYDIDIYQFRLLTPVGRNWSLGLDVSREIMSGASPWGTVAGAGGQPQLIMSGATIKDSRTETALTLSNYREGSSTQLTLTHSDEDDYESRAITLAGDWDFQGGLSTLSLGVSYSSDDISPSDAEAFGRVTDEEKRSRSISAAWTRILSKTSLLQVGASLTKRWGFLSDPYKLRDTRPDERLEKTVSVRYRQYITAANAALHLDYRYFRDDFGIRSHTLEAGWHQPVGDHLRIVPSVRYYSQQEADFYLLPDDFLLPPGQSQSSDFRLSSFGAWSYGVKAVVALDEWTVDLAMERYISDGDYGLDDPAVSHPALLEFELVSLGVSYRF